MPFKPTKSNNYGNGWTFTFQDGTSSWAMGMSPSEIKNMAAKHGKLTSKTPGSAVPRPRL